MRSFSEEGLTIRCDLGEIGEVSMDIWAFDKSDVTFVTISSSETSVGKVDNRRRVSCSLSVATG